MVALGTCVHCSPMSERQAIAALPPGLLEETGTKRLHIGGTQRKEGWIVFNALPGDYVDILGDVRDLSQFEDESFDMIYGCHILEHLSYINDLPNVLKNLHRILKPRGRLFASVPDLQVLAQLFLHPELTGPERFHVMRMMFGGQVDAFDFHYVGLTDEFLVELLRPLGFRAIYRVPAFGLFEDTSNLAFKGVPISLNMVAVR